MKVPDLQLMAKNWPSPFVARDQEILDRFSGGILNAKTLSNHDSLGTGPKGKIRINSRIAYPVHSLIDWMVERLIVTDSTKQEGEQS